MFDKIDLIRKFLTELMEIPEEGNEKPNADTGADLRPAVSGGRKEKRMGERTLIFHVDVNAAYLSWEAVYRIRHLGGREDLRLQASAVGGDAVLRRGIILAKSIPAGEMGVKTGETIFQAREKCPHLKLVPPHYQLYQRCSQALMALLGEYTDRVEQYSVDEAFMDMSRIPEAVLDPRQTAEELGERIFRELGFTVNIGISSNRLLAKMASDFQKPGRVHTLFPEEVPGRMWPLPVERLFFAGPASVRRLKTLGITTVGQLARTDPGILKSHLKKQGEVLWAFANGLDGEPVRDHPPKQKEYGSSTTAPRDLRSRQDAMLVLLGLAETLGSRLREDGVQARVLAVHVTDWEFAGRSHQKTLEDPTDLAGEIYRQAADLFDRMWDGTPVRKLGIHAGRVCPRRQTRQRSLFGPDYEKWERAERAVDRIRSEYGIDAVKRAVFLRPPFPVDHMSGGISRERRTVDYEKEKVR